MANANKYDIDNPRITAILALPAATVLSLQDFIINLLSTKAHAKYLFANEIVADQVARYAVSGVTNGYIVFQTDNTTFYEVTNDAALSGAAGWTAQATNQLRTLQGFLNNLSWKVSTDSSIGNAGANATYVMNGWMNQVTPSTTAMTTYGVPLAAATERTFSGHAKHYFLYSASGTNILLDLVFVVGSN